MIETALLVTAVSLTAGWLIAGILPYDYDYSYEQEEDRLYRQNCIDCNNNNSGEEYRE